MGYGYESKKENNIRLWSDPYVGGDCSTHGDNPRASASDRKTGSCEASPSAQTPLWDHKSGGDTVMDKGKSKECVVCGMPLVEMPRLGFLIGKTPVTPAQWASVMGECRPNSGAVTSPINDFIPVECWKFIEKLNSNPEVIERGLTFSIPTREEWMSARSVRRKIRVSVNVSEYCTDGKGRGGNENDFLHRMGLSGLRVVAFREMKCGWWNRLEKDCWVRILRGLKGCPEAMGRCGCLGDFKGNDWARIGISCRTDYASAFAEQCDKYGGWKDFSGSNWCDVLCGHPQFADRCDEFNGWSRMDAWNWACVLADHPQFAVRCDEVDGWRRLDGANWADLLSAQPQLADRCAFVVGW